MSDPDEVSPDIDLKNQRLITEFFTGLNTRSRKRQHLRSKEENQAKQMKNDDRLLENQMVCANKKKIVGKVNNRSSHKTTKVSGEAVARSAFDRKSSSVVQNSTMTRSKARLSVSDSSIEIKNDDSTDEECVNAKVRASRTSRVTEPEISISSDEYDNESVEKPCFNRTNNMNLEFYRNKIRSVPDGDFIENILKDWKDDFKKLEKHHGYIQWLFPIRESGMNSRAQVLQEDEAKAIKKNPVLKDRLLRAYKMMLGFYGLKLENDTDGTVGPSSLYGSRIAHLNASFHNNLRITRILKALGELGFEHFKKPLVSCLVNEAYQKKTLVNCQRSCVNFWIPTIEDKKEREALEKLTRTRKRCETQSCRKLR